MKSQTDVKRLYRLADLDEYTVAEGETDIRDWNVYTSDEVKIGKVTDLIVDTEVMKATYIDMILDENFRTGKTENHLLVPLEIVSVSAGRTDMVKIANISSADVINYPLYNGSDIPGDYEETLREKIMKRGGNTGS
jgi:sporulation protein YlmC with PRC-barrel domain